MKTVIVGCGRMGAGLARALSQGHHQVTVIDKNPAAFRRLGPTFTGQTFEGSGVSREILLTAGIERADGLAAVTDSDETNVMAAQLARDVFHVPRVVARIYDPRQAEIYHGSGLQTICTTTWGIHRISEILSHSRLNTVLTQGDIDVVELEIPHILVGRTAKEITIPGETSLIAITRDGKTILPTSATIFQSGDLVHLAVLTTATSKLNALLELA